MIPSLLVEIDNWDFHWQGFHSFQKPIKVPANSRLYGIATYDNTYNNPNGPRPIQTVHVGESTTDEMMLFYFSYLLYQNGDENIVIDTTSHEAHYQNCVPTYDPNAVVNPTGIINTSSNTAFAIYPNPAQNLLHYESMDEIKQMTLTDVMGKAVKEIASPAMSGQLSIGDLSTGLYFVRVQNQNGTSRTERFVKE